MCFRAIGAGFVGGLEPLAKSYGVEVGEGESAAPQPVEKSAVKPVNLSKITLEKKGQSISLEKKPQGQLGKILINLNWNATPLKSAGFFSKTAAGIDLDLACLYQFQDGTVGGVQALGNRYGNLLQPPYIQLDQDDRSGASLTGENLMINGDYWHLFKRILVFTFIYKGVPNWAHVDARITFAAGRMFHGELPTNNVTQHSLYSITLYNISILITNLRTRFTKLRAFLTAAAFDSCHPLPAFTQLENSAFQNLDDLIIIPVYTQSAFHSNLATHQ